MTMVTIGWHASHEQVPPGALLRGAELAGQLGFDAGMCSDHFAPWSERQSESGFAWSWLGAALASTTMPFGVVNAPGQRYHPAIVAQAVATLAEMFPERLWVALGTGEALNEHVTGQRWPDKPTRTARLEECVAVIRALLRGEEVSHQGLVTVDRARLWTLPAIPPPLIGAAVSAATAAWVGRWADGLITVNQPPARLTKVLDAFRSNGGAAKPAYLQVHLAWADSTEEARRIAHDQWRTNVFESPLCWDLDTPSAFDGAAKFVRPADLDESVLISHDLGWHRDRLGELADLGFDGLWLHHVGREQRRFLEAFATHVVPALRTVSPTPSA